MTKDKRIRLNELYSQLSWQDRIEIYFRAYMLRWLTLERQRGEAYTRQNHPWYLLEPLQERNTPRMHLVSIISAISVIAISITISVANPMNLMIIPAFALFSVGVLVLRQIKLHALKT